MKKSPSFWSMMMVVCVGVAGAACGSHGERAEHTDSSLGASSGRVPSERVANTGDRGAPSVSAVPTEAHSAVTLVKDPSAVGSGKNNAGSAAGASSGAIVLSASQAEIKVPQSVLSTSEKRPYIIYLHGLGGNGASLEKVLSIREMAEAHRFVYSVPDGTMSNHNQRFWNASSACCNLDAIAVDHVSEFRALIERAKANPHVDPSRLFVVGLSNGGFMAHRLACEISEIAGIASVAGAGPTSTETCQSSGNIAVLQIHGDKDDVIPFGGGHALKNAALPVHPGARETIGAWAKRNHCSSNALPAGNLNLEPKMPGDETSILRFDHCDKPVEMWTVSDGTHFIGSSRQAQEQILAFFEKQKVKQ